MPWFTKQRKKKAKNASKVRILDVSASFNAYFGLFRPYRSPTNTIWYGWYDLILAESARFGTNRSRFGMNRAAPAQIEPSWRESEKKKKKLRRGIDVRATTLNAGAAPSQSRPCFLEFHASREHNYDRWFTANYKLVLFIPQKLP